MNNGGGWNKDWSAGGRRVGNLAVVLMRAIFVLAFALVMGSLRGLSSLKAETVVSWEAALGQMPLGSPVTKLGPTNCIRLMLGAFQSNQVVKALIFMPGATDEFYLFRRAEAFLTNSSPTLLDALCALTNQTAIRADFQPPFLLLYSEMDPLDLIIHLDYPPAAERLKKVPFLPHVNYYDREWDELQRVLKRTLKLDVQPTRGSPESWHFYRSCFAGWNLNGWEALQAVALASKTRFTLRQGTEPSRTPEQVVFEGDPRYRAIPTLSKPPR